MRVDLRGSDKFDANVCGHLKFRSRWRIPNAALAFCLALTTVELERLAGEVRRVLRPGGVVVYTARTTADAPYGTCMPRGDDMYEHGGVIVHFFHRLAVGFELIDVSDVTQGSAAPPACSRDHTGFTVLALAGRPDLGGHGGS